MRTGPRALPTAVYLLLNGLLVGLLLAALENVWAARHWLAAGLLCAPLSALVELLFRALADRRRARGEGRPPAGSRALLARPTLLRPLPTPAAYLGQAGAGLGAGLVVLFGAGVLFGGPTFPLFTAAFPLIVAHAALRPLLVERDSLGPWRVGGLHRRVDLP